MATIRVWHENLFNPGGQAQTTDIEVSPDEEIEIEVEKGALDVSVIEGEDVTQLWSWAKGKWIGYRYTA